MSLADEKERYLRSGILPEDINISDQLSDNAISYLKETKFTIDSINKLVEKYEGDVFQTFFIIKLRELVYDEPDISIKACERIFKIFFTIMNCMAFCYEYPMDEGIHMTLSDMKKVNLIDSFSDTYNSNTINISVTFTFLDEEAEWNINFTVNIIQRNIFLVFIQSKPLSMLDNIEPPSKRIKLDPL
jgi:hypothetical protein